MTRTTFGFDTEATAHAFSVDTESRTIRGLAVPYGVEARKNGIRYQFERGSIRWADPSRVKLLLQHDRSQAIGKATELRDEEDGLYATFSVAPGPQGDRALAMAAHGTWDGLSVGLHDGAKFDNRDDIYVSVDAPLAEISLTPTPAFDDARVSSVLASADEEGTIIMTESQTHEAGSVPVQFDAAPITEAIAAGFAASRAYNLGDREVIPAGSGVQVSEAPLYRFDGGRGQHDFSTDLINGLKGDREAKDRVDGFMADMGRLAFDVDMADGATLNPSRQVPGMYVDQLDFTTPVWDAIHKGTLADKTPFILPKFNTSSGLVATHTEGVEPTPGAWTATSQTITPKALSGKVEITREVWDQGGNPQLSGLIWREMVRAWNEGLEVYAVEMLDALTPTAIALSGTDATLDNGITSALASLQYIRGGNRFRDLVVASNLFSALITATDDTGRKLYPVLGATNATGTVNGDFGAVQIGSLAARPSWALESGNGGDGSSYLFNRGDVHGWASTPERLTFEYRVAYVDLAIWGYAAAACTRLGGVREVTYS